MGRRARRLERAGIVAGVLLVVVLPTVQHGWPTSVAGCLLVALVLAAGFALAAWRTRPRASSAATLGLLLLAAPLPGRYPDSAVVLFAAAIVVLAAGWTGRAAWAAAAAAALYLVLLVVATRTTDVVPVLMSAVPPYLAGLALRLRRETADQLAGRVRELEEERELHAEIVVRHERARIASELHDIVGHAISVMVVQAAAGKRLAATDPVRAGAAFDAIAESAEEGRQDLGRLVELLSRGGTDAADGRGLALIDEIADRAARTGLRVSCRREAGVADPPGPVAAIAVRVVQEGLTNVLRHAPGASVVVTVAVRPDDLVVRVANDRSPARSALLVGTGRGLVGLRERVLAERGGFRAGRTPDGGWLVEARLPIVDDRPRP